MEIYHFDKEQKVRAERIRGKFNDIKLRLIHFYEVFEKEEQRVDALIREFDWFSDGLSFENLTEQEIMSLLPVCRGVSSALKDCKSKYEKLSKLLNQLIERYDEYSRTYFVPIRPPLIIHDESKVLRETANKIKRTREDSPDK